MVSEPHDRGRRLVLGVLFVGIWASILASGFWPFGAALHEVVTWLFAFPAAVLVAGPWLSDLLRQRSGGTARWALADGFFLLMLIGVPWPGMLVLSGVVVVCFLAVRAPGSPVTQPAGRP